MSISQQEATQFEKTLNNKLQQFGTEFVMTVHFAVERLNDPRNEPPITLQELESIFDRLIEHHILAVVALDDGDTFNIRCLSSHINMPCAVSKTTTDNGTVSHKNFIITIMRKEDFYAKDPVEFQV